MPRKRKQDVKINDTSSLEGLMQELYNDACLNIIDAQTGINELKAATVPLDVDDHTKIAKEKGGFLKIKDSAIRVKLELAKLQSEIIKSNGNLDEAIKNASQGKASTADFKSLREFMKNGGSSDENKDTE